MVVNFSRHDTDCCLGFLRHHILFLIPKKEMETGMEMMYSRLEALLMLCSGASVFQLNAKIKKM